MLEAAAAHDHTTKREKVEGQREKGFGVGDAVDFVEWRRVGLLMAEELQKR